MKRISNARHQSDGRTSWVMTRTDCNGTPVSRQFMYSHEMLENAHNGRALAAHSLRRARAALIADVARPRSQGCTIDELCDFFKVPRQSITYDPAQK